MNKKLKLTALIMLALIGLTSGGVFANFQSSPNVSGTSKNLQTWMLGVRQMEAPGQVMGLNETCNTTSLVAENSNNIDVHLQKNTEYGTMLILAVSDFGKQGNGESKSEYISDSTYGLATTTGNTSGVYITTNYESVAGGYAYSSGENGLNGTNSRYRNVYDYYNLGYNDSTTYTQKSIITGDAMDIANWQGGGEGTWLYSKPYSSTSSSKRTYRLHWYRYGFGYYSETTYSATSSSQGYFVNSDHYARAVVVCGNGI